VRAPACRGERLILVLGLVLLGCFAAYAWLLARNVHLGWISILLVQLYEFSFGIRQVLAGGIHLDPVDVVSIALLLAGIVRTLPRLTERNTARVLGLGALLIFAVSLIRGSIANGFIPAANEARGFVPMIASVLYFLTAPVDSRSIRRFIRLYFYYSLAFVVVAILAYAGLHIGGTAWLHATAGDTDTIEDRLLPATAALGIALSFFYSLAWTSHRGSNAFIRWLPPLFLGTAIFLRHRSVWSVLAFSSLALLFTDTRLLRRYLSLAAMSLLVIGAFVAVTSLTRSAESGGTVSSTESQFSQSASDTGTWIWRVEVWGAILFGEDQTTATVLLGKPLGSGYVTLNAQAGNWINSPPHSEYVSDYSRIGVIGTVLLLCYLVRPLLRFWSLSRTNKLAVEPSTSAWVALLVGLIVYGITYTIPLDSFALAGIAGAMVYRWQHEAADSVSDPMEEAAAVAA
jgi:hypothetical protein